MERKHKIFFVSLVSVLVVALGFCIYFSYVQLMDYLQTIAPQNSESSFVSSEISGGESSNSSSTSSSFNPDPTPTPDQTTTPIPNPQICSHLNTEIRGEEEKTCTKNGYTGDKYCRDCSELLERGRPIVTSGHGSIKLLDTKSATCTEKGYSGDKKCVDCSQIIEKGSDIAPLGHRNLTVVGAKEATCTENGNTGDKKCGVCGVITEKGAVISPLGHRNLTTVNAKSATCTENGNTGDKKCGVCGVITEKGAVINALGHRNTTVINVSRTYTGDHVCGVCEHVFERGMSYTPGTDPADMSSATILGAPVLTIDQMVSYVDRLISLPDMRINCSLYELAAIYIEEGLKEGVRGDIAFCQSIIETGWFRFTGSSVSPTQNNFCGLGATDIDPRPATFSSVRLGVRAQIQHLKGYASKTLNGECVDPRYNVLKSTSYFGNCPLWADLNGKWASGANYSEKIMTKYLECRAQAVNTSSVEASKVIYPYSV